MTEKPCIFIFSTSYYPYVGGAEVAVKEITDRLPDYEWHLITALFNNDLKKEEKIGNITVHRIGFGTQFDKVLLPFLGTIKGIFLVKKYRSVTFWCIMVTFASGIAYIINILRTPFARIPIILTLQEGDSEEHINKKQFGIGGFIWQILMIPAVLVSFYKRIWHTDKKQKRVYSNGMIKLAWHLALDRTSFVTVISNYLGQQARHYGYTGPYELIPNGVDIKHFAGTEMWKQEATHMVNKLGKNPGDVFLITVSRLVEKNAVDDIIKTLEYLPTHVSLLILGSGEKQGELEKLVKDMKLEERVHFIGFVSHEELPGYLYASDIFIRPSLSEGMGNSFIEAMATQIPVIATPVGGIPDFLFDPDTPEGANFPTGFLCRVKDPASIAQQVTRILENAELKEKITSNAFQLVTEKYGWDKIATDMKEKVLDRLLTK